MNEVLIEPCKKCGSDYYRLRYCTKGTYLSILHYPQYDDDFNLVKDNILTSDLIPITNNINIGNEKSTINKIYVKNVCNFNYHFDVYIINEESLFISYNSYFFNIKNKDSSMHIVSDSVWNVIKNLLPQKKSSVGRPRLDQKKVFEGIIFIID